MTALPPNLSCLPFRPFNATNSRKFTLFSCTNFFLVPERVRHLFLSSSAQERSFFHFLVLDLFLWSLVSILQGYQGILWLYPLFYNSKCNLKRLSFRAIKALRICISERFSSAFPFELGSSIQAFSSIFEDISRGPCSELMHLLCSVFLFSSCVLSWYTSGVC